MNIQFQAVIFDMDGLMFDTERIGLDAFRHAARLHGYEDTQGTFLKMIGRNVQDADQIMREDFGESFPIADVRVGRAEYLENIRKTSGIPMKVGLLELLSFLHMQNIPLAVASSSARAVVEEHLSIGGIQQYFLHLTCGDEVTMGKPHPEIFLKAAAKLVVEPQSCIVLEDSASGIQAAHAAGMIPIMVPDIKHPTQEIELLAHRIFPSLREVQSYLSDRF